MGKITSTVSLLVFVACSHLQQPPLQLNHVLRLETTSAPSRITAGEMIEATFTLHNLSDSALDLCSPSGVSIMLKSESPGYVWPIYLHGITTDVACSGPIHLDRGGTATFVEHGAIRGDLPAGKPLLVGKLSLWCQDPKSCAEVTLESSMPVTVSAATSN